jgi:hypothetical protein
MHGIRSGRKACAEADGFYHRGESQLADSQLAQIWGVGSKPGWLDCCKRHKKTGAKNPGQHGFIAIEILLQEHPETMMTEWFPALAQIRNPIQRAGKKLKHISR